MTLQELLKMLGGHKGKLIFIPLLCCALAFVGATALSVIKPSYSATAEVNTSGGSFTSAAGYADTVAEKSSGDGATVTASATSTKNLVTFTAKATSEDSAVDAANNAANAFSKEATEKSLVSGTTVSTANSASNNSKSPALYGLIGLFGGLFCVIAWLYMVDSLKGGIHGATAVEELGVPFLGEINDDPINQQLLVANLKYAGQSKGSVARRVCLVPAGTGVRIRSAFGALYNAEVADKPSLAVAPPLSASADAVYRGREADSVAIVVEEGVSTIDDVRTLVHELQIVDVPLAGFFYLTPQDER